MMEGKIIIASGPVIIEEGKLLVNKDEKDEFWKIPGGTIEEGTEDLEEACKKKVKEEINAKIKIIKVLSPMAVYKNPTTKEKMTIILIHYLAKLENRKDIKATGTTKEISWLPISEIKKGKHNVAPNIKFLLERREIK